MKIFPKGAEHRDIRIQILRCSAPLIADNLNFLQIFRCSAPFEIGNLKSSLSQIKMTKAFFRILLLGMGIFTCYFFGGAAAKTVWFRVAGTTVEGRVEGFLAGRNSPSVQKEGTGVRKGKTRARRPVFKYPLAEGSSDSLTARSSTAVMFSFSQYELGEKVPVVFSPGKPEDAHIFGFQLIAMNFLVLLLGIFMLKIGATGRA